MVSIVTLLQEEAWIYGAEPDWAVNLTRLARGRSLTPSSRWPYSLPRMPRCIHWAKGDAGVKGGCNGAPQACKCSDRGGNSETLIQ